ncbi:MAG: Gfo/Idh/MocA family oxidoreductase [Clostridia bacterium]|nr:Gfo/Idh/MocA family oxidoreductase [Clostridia bacterium]
MSKLKIGVFGAGRGMTMIDQVLHRGDAVLVAVCDKYEPLLEKCRKKAEEVGLECPALYTDFEEFFKHDMDAVVVANYAHQHVPFAIRLLDSGRHVMTECLTCATMKEAVELIEAVERNPNCVYTYAENYCYTPARWEMRERYRRGDIGELLYAEGEYCHDCSSIWPQITYGERDHWRNQDYSTFYCTHSIGPILSMTGLRPIQVSGFETPDAEYMRKLGANAPVAGMEIITLENGAIFKSVHGGFKHATHVSNYQLNGTRGAFRDIGEGKLLAYIEGENENCRGKYNTYEPKPVIEESAESGHGGADFYTTHYFIRSILGDPVAKERAIDVYTAVDMCIPGILAYRSICNGNAPIKVPNLRNKEERDAYRNDAFCTFPEVAGDQWVSNNIHGFEPIPDEVYEEVRRKWQAGEPG